MSETLIKDRTKTERFPTEVGNLNNKKQTKNRKVFRLCRQTLITKQETIWGSIQTTNCTERTFITNSAFTAICTTPVSHQRDKCSNTEMTAQWYYMYIAYEYMHNRLKAILQVLIYKALYDKSYLGSKATMTSGEWTCLISFATAPLTCSERGGSEKFKMKIYVSIGIRTHTPPVHDRKVAAP